MGRGSLKFLSTFHLLQLFSVERFFKNGKLVKFVSLCRKQPQRLAISRGPAGRLVWYLFSKAS